MFIVYLPIICARLTHKVKSYKKVLSSDRQSTVYSVNDVPGKDPWERPLGKTPQVGLQWSEGSFHVKDALERPLRPLKPPWGVFPWDIIDGVYCTFT